MPATPCDAKGLLISAILDPNPVIVIEHRRLYDTIGNVPAGFYKVPLGKAKVVRKGSDLTMVAISEMLLEAGIAAKVLHNVEIEVEIIDPRTIQPLDKNTILKSVEKTGRLIICDTGCKDFGVSAEIAASVAEDAFGYLKSPIKRIGLPFGPTPASYQLENYYYPGVADIIKAVAEILPKDQAGKLRNLTASEAEMSKFIGIF
jgi:pyruvate dehydrogenase E1 component beta subunit